MIPKAMRDMFKRVFTM
jgi:hypothetical protein